MKNPYTTLRSGLRRVWLKSPLRAEALKAAREPYVGDNRRRKWQYPCSVCHNVFELKEVQVDHIHEAGTLLEFSHLHNFLIKLFCKADSLRVMCIECHKKHTKAQRALTKNK